MAATRSANVAVILEMTAEWILGRWLKYLLTFVAKNTDFNMASLTGLSRFNLSLHNENRSGSFVSKSFSYILNLGSINHSIPINCICWVPMTIKSEGIGLKLQNLYVEFGLQCVFRFVRVYHEQPKFRWRADHMTIVTRVTPQSRTDSCTPKNDNQEKDAINQLQFNTETLTSF